MWLKNLTSYYKSSLTSSNVVEGEIGQGEEKTYMQSEVFITQQLRDCGQVTKPPPSVRTVSSVKVLR